MSNKIQVDVECSSCGGSGLYCGFAEKNGCAVICSTCNGTGCEKISYKPFVKRHIKHTIKRVFKSSYGYCHGPNNVITDEGVLIRFEEGGCTYQEWLNGAEPKPVKDLYCPYLWNNRGIGNEPLNRCKEDNTLCGRISNCKYYKDKAKCWELYEKRGKG